MQSTEQLLFKNKISNQKSDVNLEGDITFRVFNQLSLDILFDMKMVFGHLLTEWKDTNKIFGLAVVNHRCFFNLESTILGFRRAFLFLSKALTSYRRTSITFVSGLPKYDNFSDFLNFHKTNMPLLGYGYAIHWVPGILTNFAMLISKFWGRPEVMIPRYTKTLKRNWFFESVRGMKLFHTFPDFVCFFSTSGIYEIAIKEAFILKIPTIGFVDSDQEVTRVTFPIVGNDDSVMGLEIKIYLFRELILRSLKNFLFTEIEQLLVEQSRLQQVVFQTYFVDRFRELLRYEKAKFYSRTQRKPTLQLEEEIKSKFRNQKLNLYKNFFKRFHKMSLFFFKKTALNYNQGLLTGNRMFDVSLKSKKEIKFSVIKNVTSVPVILLKKKKKFVFNFADNPFNKLKSLSFFLLTRKRRLFRFVRKKKLKVKTGRAVKIENFFVLETFLLFIKEVFVLQMFFTFLFPFKDIFMKENLKLNWLFFVSNNILKKNSRSPLLDIFLNFINLYKNISNFCAYLMQFRMTFFYGYFSVILNKNNNIFPIISECVLCLEKKFNIQNFGYKKYLKNKKFLKKNFLFFFIRPLFYFTKFLFSSKFYSSRSLKLKKKTRLQQKKIKVYKVKKVRSSFKKQKKSRKFLMTLTNMLHMNEKNAQTFLAKKLIFWKLYKLKYRKFLSVEKKLQRHSFLRFVLQKFSKLFIHFPSLRGFFLRTRKNTERIKKRNFEAKLPWRPSPFWFKFGLKRSLLFFLKNLNIKKKKYKKLGFFRSRWSPLKKRNIKRYFFHKGRFRFFRKKVPSFLFKRFHKWLREKPFVNVVFPKFSSPRYATNAFHNYSAFELAHYQRFKIHFFFNFLNYVKYKKKLLICFFELKILVKFLLHQKFKFNLFKFLISFSNNKLKSFFLLLQKKLLENLKVNLNYKFLNLFSKFYNLILLEFSVLFKNSFFMQSSIQFFLLFRFFYYIQKFITIFNISKREFVSIFLQIKAFFSFFKMDYSLSFFFLSKNIISKFFNYKKKRKTFVMKKIVMFIKKKRKLKKTVVYQKLNRHKPDYFQFIRQLSRRSKRKELKSLKGRKGRKGRKGLKFSKFSKICKKYLRNSFQIFLKDTETFKLLKKKYSRLNLLKFFYGLYISSNNLQIKTSFHKVQRSFPKRRRYRYLFRVKKKNSALIRDFQPFLPSLMNKRHMYKIVNYLKILYKSEQRKIIDAVKKGSIKKSRSCSKKFWFSKFKTKNLQTRLSVFENKNCLRRKRGFVEHKLVKENQKQENFKSKLPQRSQGFFEPKLLQRSQGFSESKLNEGSQKKFLGFYRAKNKKHNKPFFDYSALDFSPKAMFGLRSLRKFERESFNKNLNYLKQKKQTYYKKKPIQLNYLETIFRFKERFINKNFYKYRALNFSAVFAAKVLVNKTNTLRVFNRLWKVIGFCRFKFHRSRGFLVKVLSYKGNFLKKMRDTKLSLKEKKINFSLFSFPLVPATKKNRATNHFFFKDKIFFHKDFGFSVKFNYNNKNLINERKNFTKIVVQRRRRLLNKLRFRAKKKYKFRLKFKNMGFIFKRFRFYYKKLKKILHFFFNKISKKSKTSFNKFNLLTFFNKQKGVGLLSLLIRKSFLLFLYRMFLSFKLVDLSFIKLRWHKNKKNKIIKKRVKVGPHFSYINYLKTKGLLKKSRMLTLLFLFSKLKKAREFYFFKFSKILLNQNRFMRRTFSKKNLQLLRFYY